MQHGLDDHVCNRKDRSSIRALTSEGKEEICHAVVSSKQHMEKASTADKEKDSSKKRDREQPQQRSGSPGELCSQLLRDPGAMEHLEPKSN